MKHSNIGIFIPHLACPHACVFCDQRTISGTEKAPTPSEVAAMLKDAVAGLSGDGETEIAFFGGTFTGLPLPLMEKYLDAANGYIGQKGITGIRLSTRPDFISEPILETLKKYGVTDIELGVQSMDDGVLRLSERGHTAADTVRASEMIKNHGFDLGLQFMPGLPGDTPEKSLATARNIAALSPSAVRIYPTLVIKGTKLEKMYNDGVFKPFTLETAVKLTAEMKELFDSKGITILRMGLHSDIDPEKIVAGPYHPAFGELVYTELYRRAFDRAMEGKTARNPVFAVAPELLSQAKGHKKSNLEYITDRYGLFSDIIPDKGEIPDDAIRVQKIY